MTNDSSCNPAPRDQAGESRFAQQVPVSVRFPAKNDSLDRLRDTLHHQIVGALENAMPEGTPGPADRDVWGTVAGHLEVGDIEEALRMLGKGAGQELRPNDRGRVPACSAHSSALMAVNFLAPFVSRAAPRWPCGPISFERELRVAGVRSSVGPTLDAVIEGTTGTLAIEAKLAEPWRDRPGFSLSEQYDVPAAHVSFRTRAVLDQVRRNGLGFEFLDARQLVRHLLGIHSAIDSGELLAPATLMLLYWQPSDAGPFRGLFARLRAECADLEAQLDDQPVRIVAVGTDELLEEWSSSDQRWLREHAAHLRRRYDVTVIECDD